MFGIFKHNGGAGGYRARMAQGLALARRQGKARARLTAADWDDVEGYLRQNWSPGRPICGWRRRGSAGSATSGFAGTLGVTGAATASCTSICASKSAARYQAECPLMRARQLPVAARLGDWELGTLIGKWHKGALLSLTEHFVALGVG